MDRTKPTVPDNGAETKPSMSHNDETKPSTTNDDRTKPSTSDDDDSKISVPKGYETMTAVPEDELDRVMLTEFEENGLRGVYELAENLLNRWKVTCLNIGVTGRSGTGKSSFINAVRGVRPNQPTAASVGVTQKTTMVTSYPHPENENLLLWDIPGVGTPEFPRDTYLSKISFEMYDLYIILSSDRFTEDDLWLASEIQKSEKKCFFVRTKIDESIKNEKIDHPDTFSEEDVLSEIRKDCIDHLKKEKMEDVPVFLISSRKPAKWDFQKAMIELTNSCPGIKQEVALLTFRATCKSLIEKKKVLLQKAIKCTL